MTSAYAILFSINCNLEFHVRHTVLNYYEADVSEQEIGDWPEKAMDDAVLRAQELHLSRSEDIDRIQADPTMAHIRKQLDKLADEAAKSSAARREELDARGVPRPGS